MLTHSCGVGIFESVGVLTPQRRGSHAGMDIHLSSAARSRICWPRAGRWRPCRPISVCRTRRSRTGDARTLLTEPWIRVSLLRRRRNCGLPVVESPS